MASLTDFLKSTYKQILDELRDLSYVEVITAAGNTDVNLDAKENDILDALKTTADKKPTILARTKIELDGDIFMIVPTKDDGSAQIDKEVLAIHKENVDAAVYNWNQFMNTILQAIEITTKIAGLTGAKIGDLQLDFKEPGKTA